MIEIQCTQCKAFIARYTGVGDLSLLLFEKIIKPALLTELKSSKKSDLTFLVCQGCNCKLGKPAIDDKGRVGYKMIKGSFRKKGVIKAMTPSPHTSWR